MKLSLIVLVLGLSGCATKPPEKPAPFSGICAIQPIAAQEGVLLAAVQCQ